jgi:hypothetical protein
VLAACAVCIASGVGGGYSRSTYDEYGKSVNEVGSQTVAPWLTMVWKRIFFIVEAKCTSSHPDLRG